MPIESIKAEVSVAWWVRWYIRALILLTHLGVKPDMERVGERIKRGVRARLVSVPSV
ncbi:MAG: hypothetical protein AAFO57_00500 [Pseudomonadota bacterium]